MTLNYISFIQFFFISIVQKLKNEKKPVFKEIVSFFTEI